MDATFMSLCLDFGIGEALDSVAVSCLLFCSAVISWCFVGVRGWFLGVDVVGGGFGGLEGVGGRFFMLLC
jgi:hypothetical protein